MARRKATTIKQAQEAAKAAAREFKQAKKKALDQIADGGKVPHNFTSSFHPELKNCWPDISRDTINNNYQSWVKGRVDVSENYDKDDLKEQHLDTNSSKSCPHNHSSPPQIGRPQGTTEEAYKLGLDCYKAVKNEISLKYKKMKEEKGGKN